MPNIELFEKVKAFLREEPKRFYMFGIIVRPEEVEFFNTFDPPCGTACCIYGAACLVTDTKPEDSFVIHGADLFGISGPQARRLFMVGFWPQDLISEYYNAHDDSNPAAAVEVGCAMIDAIIAECGV